MEVLQFKNDTFKTFNANDGIPFGYVNTMLVEGKYGLELWMALCFITEKNLEYTLRMMD